MNDNLCDGLSESFANIKKSYVRMNTTIDNMNNKLDKIDTLITQYKNKNQENRPSCIPGFYTATKSGQPAMTMTASSPAGMASNAVRAIRSKHYR